jgi:hypothetical protein
MWKLDRHLCRRVHRADLHGALLARYAVTSPTRNVPGRGLHLPRSGFVQCGFYQPERGAGALGGWLLDAANPLEFLSLRGFPHDPSVASQREGATPRQRRNARVKLEVSR